MSQFPPAFGQQQQYTQPPTSRTTNVWAIVSLVCGIIGCFVITPIVGIITGIIGLAKSRVSGGKGMSIAGIVLSILWIIGGIGMAGAGYWGVNKVVAMVGQATEKPSVDFINALIEDPNGMYVGMNSSLFGPQAQALSDKLKPLGKCTKVDVSSLTSSPNMSNVNGVISYSYTRAPATFDSGQTVPVSAKFETREGRLIITQFEVE